MLYLPLCPPSLRSVRQFPSAPSRRSRAAAVQSAQFPKCFGEQKVLENQVGYFAPFRSALRRLPRPSGWRACGERLLLQAGQDAVRLLVSTNPEALPTQAQEG